MKLAVLVLIFAVCPVWGQIVQSHPEYCGIAGGVNPPLPPDISATIDQSAGHAVLYIDRGGMAKAVPLPDLISEVAEVCPLADGRLVVFADFGGTDVFIVDRVTASVTDWFPAYFPEMSPDQRWIVYRKFYPLHGVEASDELLIYDLTKTPAQNRPGGANGSTDPGRLIFPPGENGVPYENIGVPTDQMHSIGRRIYWAADSRALLFTDRVAGRPDRITLVTLDDRDRSAAFQRQVTIRDMCGLAVPSADLDWRMDQAEVGPEQSGNRSIVIDLGHRADRRCPPHALQLYKNDFQPLKPELHVTEKPSHGMIREGYPPVPPKKK